MPQNKTQQHHRCYTFETLSKTTWLRLMKRCKQLRGCIKVEAMRCFNKNMRAQFHVNMESGDGYQYILEVLCANRICYIMSPFNITKTADMSIPCVWKDGCKSHETDQPTGQLVSQVLPRNSQKNRRFPTHKCGVSGIISFIEMYCAFNHYSF